MVVVADSTPLRYLALTGYGNVLPALFGRVLTPRSVVRELRHPHSPAAVRALLTYPPAWLDVRQVTRAADAGLAVLDTGERDAIQLVQELQADLLLVDDGAARDAATIRGISIMGTVGILEHASIHGLLIRCGRLPEGGRSRRHVRGTTGSVRDPGDRQQRQHHQPPWLPAAHVRWRLTRCRLLESQN